MTGSEVGRSKAALRLLADEVDRRPGRGCSANGASRDRDGPIWRGRRLSSYALSDVGDRRRRNAEQ